MSYKLREEVEKIINEAFSFWTPEQLRAEADQGGSYGVVGGFPTDILREIADQIESDRRPNQIFRVDD